MSKRGPSKRGPLEDTVTGYSEDYFLELSRTNPQELLALVRDDRLTPPDMTFAAELLGETELAEAKQVLMAMVRRSVDPLSREGGIDGLSWLIGVEDDRDLREFLAEIAEHDEDPYIRSLARGYLKEADRP